MSENKIYQDEEKKKKYAVMGNVFDEVKINPRDADIVEASDDGGGKKNEDDDQNFIKKDETAERRKKIFRDIQASIKNMAADLEIEKNGVRPEGNQQRNLDRETGGLEGAEDLGISDKDVWDGRAKEVAKMNEDAQDLNNASKSSRAQAFIYTGKQKKLKEEHNKSAGATGEHVAKLMQWRQNTKDGAGRGGDDSGRVM